jgi:hypothetical protein
MPNLEVDKPSEPLSVSYTLGELALHCRVNGSAMHVKFPSGLAAFITFTEQQKGNGTI